MKKLILSTLMLAATLTMSAIPAIEINKDYGMTQNPGW